MKADRAPEATRDLLRRRRSRLLEECERANFAGVLATRPEHVRYLSGSHGTGRRALLIDRVATRIVVPADAPDAPDLADQGFDVVTYVSYSRDVFVDPLASFTDALSSLLSAAVPARVGCDTVEWPRYAEHFRSVSVVDGRRVFAAARRGRDESEIEQIRDRVSILEAGMRAARLLTQPGATELDVAIAALSTISSLAGAVVVLDHNIGSGPRSALTDPHASPRRFNAGDLVLVDLYPELHGYFADLTRTWGVGSVGLDGARRHAAVVAALRSAERLLGPGVPAKAIDRAVRESLRAAGGFDSSMRHHSGHGLGIFAWDHPWIGAASEDVLVAGDVIAIEPGSYSAGNGGVRIEGNYLITGEGYERLDVLDDDLSLVTTPT